MNNRINMLNELLLKNHEFNAQYRGGLSNHMSMSLIALGKLQASDEQLEDFFYKNYQKLEKAPVAKEILINDENLSQHLGTYNHYADLIIFFTDQLNHLGYANTLNKYLSVLLPGVAAGAFHGLLRLAYGLFVYEENPSIGESEIVRGLAYWADSYLALGTVEQEQSVQDLLTCIDEFDCKDLQQVRVEMMKLGLHLHLIFNQLKFAVEQPQFNLFVKKIEYSVENIQSLAKFSLQLYYETLNFTALHAVTATHAFRAILPFCEQKDEAINYFWRALFCTYLTIGAPYINLNKKVTVNNIELMKDKVLDMARASSDDHVVKFVYTCFEEYQHYNDPLYIKVAGIKAGLFQVSLYHDWLKLPFLKPSEKFLSNNNAGYKNNDLVLEERSLKYGN